MCDSVPVLDQFTHNRQHTHCSTGTEPTVFTRMNFLFKKINFYDLFFFLFIVHSVFSEFQDAKSVVNSILLEQNWSKIQIPRFFLEVRELRNTLKHTQKSE